MEADKMYDKEYYESHLGEKYERNEVWLDHFGRIADRIVREIHPKTVLDVGCAKGFLVEALRDRGVDAEGIDISEYAISETREDIKPYCRLGSASDDLKKKYDLIVCIEVFEHINSIELEKALENLCNHTDEILFSSTPFDYNEETHINVKPVENWVEHFYYQGFLHDIEYDATYISIQAMRFKRRSVDVVQMIKEYERMLFSKRQEMVPLRYNFELSKERIRVMDLGNIKHGQEVDTLKLNHERKINELRFKHEQELTALRNNLENSYKGEIISLKKGYQIKLEQFAEEKDDLSENNIALRDEVKFLKNEIISYDKQIHHLIDESLFYQQKINDSMTDYNNKLADVVGSYEKSTCWKITKPIRWIGRIFGRNC